MSGSSQNWKYYTADSAATCFDAHVIYSYDFMISEIKCNVEMQITFEYVKILTIYYHSRP